jgi:tetratricopeptide (TPR) repeat protein
LQFRLHLFFSAASIMALSAGSISAQSKTGNAPSAPAPRPTIPQGNPTYGSVSRPMFVDGRVQFDDGSPTNANVRVERVCGGTVRLQAHTDSKGQFYFQLGDNAQVDTDASTLASGLSSPGIPDHSAMVPITGQRPSEMGCEIRAAYPGYRSDNYNVSMSGGSDNLHVGTIFLHRIGGVVGTTMSVTTALAPKKSQKDYDKGLQLVKKEKYDDAEHEMQAAVDSYPKYALAWFALGQLQQKRNDLADARTSYEAAVKADPHYVSPYVQLAQLAAQEKKWDETLAFSKQTLSLNSAEFASAYWYNALANCQLGKYNDAEQSLTTLLKMDTAHLYGQAEDLMGRVLLQKGDLSGAAEHLRAYLADNPNATDADVVKQTLNKIAASKVAANTPSPNQPASQP